MSVQGHHDHARRGHQQRLAATHVDQRGGGRALLKTARGHPGAR